MKKIEFTYKCHKDTASMPKGENTLYCSKCAHNIIDFTKMNSTEIAQTLKQKNVHCGTMFDWQIEEYNAYVDSLQNVQEPKRNFGNLIKAAAILGSPLVVSPASAQVAKTTYEVNSIVSTEKNVTEVMLTGENNVRLNGIELHVYNGSVLIDTVLTDINGKVLLDQSTLKGIRMVTLRNAAYGIEKSVGLGQNICIEWKTNIKLEAPEIKYDVQFIYSDDGKERTIKRSNVTMELFDENNNVIDVYKNETNGAGYSILKTNMLDKAKRVVFTLETRKGKRVAYVIATNIGKEDVTRIVIRNFRRCYSVGKF